MWCIQDYGDALVMKLTLLLLVSISLVQCRVNSTICVKHSNGSLTWNQDCTEICDSISECDYSSQVSTLIVLETGDHNLSSSLHLRERGVVKIQGCSSVTRILCINAGLLFVNIGDLHIIFFLTIENCSAVHHSVYYHANLTSAVFISEVENVTLLNVTVVNSPGNGISMFNIHDEVLVNSSIFLNSGFGNSNANVVASSGFHIECNRSASTMNVTSEKRTQIIINNSKFIGRMGNTQSNAMDHINSPVTRGLSIILGGCTAHVLSTITESLFSGNVATTGSGLLVNFLDSSHDNTVTVSSSNFTYNGYIRASDEAKRKAKHGGGGVNIMFDGRSSQNTMTIEISNFMGNTAHSGGGLFILFLNSAYENTMNVSASSFSKNGCWNDAPIAKRGGGLSVLLMDDSHDNTISIMGSFFTRNRAMRGAGMHVQFQNSSKHNSLFVVRCTFVHNNGSPNRLSIEREGGGGGIEVGYRFLGDYAPTNNSVSIITCQFMDNFANFGGGTLLFSSYAFRTDINNSFNLIDCLWQDNSANYGAAIDLSSKLLVYDYPPQGILPIPLFKNCTFITNKVFNDMDETNRTIQTRVGKGTFISTAMSARFVGTIRFENNTGSAIHVTSCFLMFDKRSNVIFSHNTGSLGAAIDLVGQSSILIDDHSRFSFINNSAVLNGGAISYFTTDRHSFASFRNCFIQYVGQTKDVNERDIEFLFNGNTAMSGNSIHATTIEHCRRRLNCTANPSNLFNCIAKFTFIGEPISHQLASAGKKFSVKSNYSFPLQVIPGKLFEIPVTMLDEFDHPIQPLYNLHLSDTTNSFVPKEYSILLKSNSTKVYGNPGNSVEITMFSKDGLHETKLSFNARDVPKLPSRICTTK